MLPNVYLYIAVAAVVTYLVRMLPLVLLKREIQSPFLRSFLYYVPFVTLSVMTFPAILSSTGSLISALGGFAAALFLAWRGKSLITVALAACAVVFVLEWFV